LASAAPSDKRFPALISACFSPETLFLQGVTDFGVFYLILLFDSQFRCNPLISLILWPQPEAKTATRRIPPLNTRLRKIGSFGSETWTKRAARRLGLDPLPRTH
jgi:hypothetical protein